MSFKQYEVLPLVIVSSCSVLYIYVGYTFIFIRNAFQAFHYCLFIYLFFFCSRQPISYIDGFYNVSIADV